MIRLLIGLGCGAVLGVVGTAAWLVWYLNKDGGIFR